MIKEKGKNREGINIPQKKTLYQIELKTVVFMKMHEYMKFVMV